MIRYSSSAVRLAMLDPKIIEPQRPATHTSGSDRKERKKKKYRKIVEHYFFPVSPRIYFIRRNSRRVPRDWTIFNLFRNTRERDSIGNPLSSRFLYFVSLLFPADDCCLFPRELSPRRVFHSRVFQFRGSRRWKVIPDNWKIVEVAYRAGSDLGSCIISRPVLAYPVCRSFAGVENFRQRRANAGRLIQIEICGVRLARGAGHDGDARDAFADEYCID